MKQSELIMVFTDENTNGGNGTIVFEGDKLSYDQKLTLAVEKGLSEIVFLDMSKEIPSLDYFTPAGRIESCGHATIGTLRYIKDHYPSVLEKNSFIETYNKEKIEYYIDGEEIYIHIGKTDIVKEMNLNDKILDDLFAENKIIYAGIFKTGIPDLIVQFASPDDIITYKPDFDLISEISKKLEVVGLHIFSISSDEVTARNFAPLYGIIEENATGTSNSSVMDIIHKKYKLENIYIFQGNLDSKGYLKAKVVDEKTYIGGRTSYRRSI